MSGLRYTIQEHLSEQQCLNFEPDQGRNNGLWPLDDADIFRVNHTRDQLLALAKEYNLIFEK